MSNRPTPQATDMPGDSGPDSAPTPCAVCGHMDYDFTPILWDELVEAWGLTPEERDAVDRQQGKRCQACRCNLRSIALARAVLGAFGLPGTLEEATRTPVSLRVLEINGAGHLSPWLQRFREHVSADFPAVDMTALPHADASFDLVIHSDTLEHIPEALTGLRECHRVLAPGGVCAFTVPMIPGRLTRSRSGLPPSYHGNFATQRDDFLVHWEFGEDIWTWAIRAGFDSVAAWAFEYPAAVAWTARRNGGV